MSIEHERDLAAIWRASDGWTSRTHDASLAAHHEQTIIVWRAGPEIVTRATA